MTVAESLLAQAVTTVRDRRTRPTDDDALAAWLWDALGVRLPARACCPEHTAPFEAFASAYFARSPIAVWRASRGFGGKAFIVTKLRLSPAATLSAEARLADGSPETCFILIARSRAPGPGSGDDV